MVQFENARNGALTALSNNVRLNSTYDPLEEARRFVSKQLEGMNPKTVVILGETLGYIAQAVTDRIPGCKCIQVYYHTTLYNQSSFLCKDAWHPNTHSTVYTFFSTAIHELDLGNIAVIEWDPSGKAFPELGQRSLLDLRKIIGVYNGNIATTAQFGRRWLRNIVHNFLALDRFARFKDQAGIAVVAAAGPTLETSIDALVKNRSSFYLLALPSSLSALLNRGLIPDLLVITDPGYYSSLHLPPAGKKKLTLAMPLSTIRDAGRYAARIVLLNQGTYLETALFKKTAIPHLSVDSHGTVAGTAFFISRQMSKKIVFAGLDLIGNDIQTHVRPHGFDPLMECCANRTIPSHTARYIRGSANLLRSDGRGGTSAFETYAGWFSNLTAADDQIVYRLNPSSVKIDGMLPLDSSSFSSLCQKEPASSKGGITLKSSDLPDTAAAPARKSLLRIILAKTRGEIEKYTDSTNPGELHNEVFTGPTPHSMVYFAAARTLLKGLRPESPETVRDAADETIRFICKLEEYIQSWPG